MTSLNASSFIAASSLRATQVQLSVASANVANADTEGYTAKTASVSSYTTSGYGAGVTVESISSNVSKYLLEDLLTATTSTAGATVTAATLDSLQQAFGSTTGADGDGSSLANSIAAFETALTGLAVTPESASLASAAVTSLQEVTYQLNSLSSEVQDKISQADNGIEDGAEAANEAILAINALNKQISAAASQGNSTADLEDELNVALATLSAQLEISTFKADDGSVKVYTESGQILVGSTTHLLTTGTGASGTTISVNGSDVTAELTEGNIGASITLRDETLPAYQDMLDQLAATFIADMNSVSAGLLTGTGASDIAVETTVVADPGLMLGGTQPSDVAFNILDALQTDTTFAPAGNLAGGDMTFTEYANDILSDLVSRTTTAQTRLDLAESELTLVSDTISSIYGVNVDEELTRLAELEQLYSVASTLLSIVQEMFDDLLAAVQ